MKEIEWSFIHGEGTIECYCDQCRRNYSFEFEDSDIDYRACQDELKSYGWVAHMIDGVWKDFCCEECFYKYIKENK